MACCQLVFAWVELKIHITFGIKMLYTVGYISIKLLGELYNSLYVIWNCFRSQNLNFLSATYAHNPQYRITLDAADEDDEQGYCNIIVELHQKNRRLRRARDHCLSIGFSVYKVWGNN